MFSWVCDEAIEQSVDFLLISGDLFDTRNVNALTLEQATAPLCVLRANNIPVFVTEGNHDRPYYKDKMGWLEYLNNESLINYLESPNHIQYGKVSLIFLGYNNKIEDNVDVVKSFHFPHGFTIAMLHAGTEGIIPNMGGCVSKEQLELLKPYCDYLALGHIHKPYDIDGWVYNPGSLEHWAISESGWDGGYYITDINTETKHFKTKHVVSPKRGMIRITDIYDKTSKGGILEKTMISGSQEDKGCILEVTLEGKMSEKPNIDEKKKFYSEIFKDALCIRIVDKTTRPSSLNSEHSTKDRTILEKEVIDKLTQDSKLTNLVIEVKNRIDEEPEMLLRVIQNDY